MRPFLYERNNIYLYYVRKPQDSFARWAVHEELLFWNVNCKKKAPRHERRTWSMWTLKTITVDVDIINSSVEQRSSITQPLDYFLITNEELW